MCYHNIKICGITQQTDACFCAEAGVGALGAVFFEPSPRYVSPQQAYHLFKDLPPSIKRVGVFVDMPITQMLAIAHEARLNTLQLHGQESLEIMLMAQAAGFRVIKVLKATGTQLIADAGALPEDIGILVECGSGPLPGGNGAAWNWSEAAPLAAMRPFALAGGLTPLNITAALQASQAIACDLSSGVENAPGIKNHNAILNTLKNIAVLNQQIPVPPQLFW